MPRAFEKSSLESCLAIIQGLPVNELKYYLLLALNSIKKADAEVYQDFLEELTVLSQKLSKFLQPEGDTLPQNLLDEVNQSFQKLCKFSQTNRLSVVVGYALIDLGSTLLAIMTGVLGGLVGGIVGLGRSICSFSNPLSHLLDGLIIGFSLGAAIGFRTPKKLFKEELTRQLKFCLDGIKESLHVLQTNIVMPLSHCKDQVESRLLKDCFAGNRTTYEQFLDSEQVFTIGTLSAQFTSKNLEGYLGHHACIILSLPNQEDPELIEFSTGQSDVKTRKLTQIETRTVTGEKIVEMMALHLQLREIHNSYAYIFTKMKAGERDCFSYVDKILLGTGQKSSTVRRFDGTENWVGRNIVGFFITKLSPFSQDILMDKPCCPLAV
ncbi:hypothetical protein [Legionella micdadei]|uniref:Uncharacterized protein n=1 Tax=Legionella micdadei TaxID=451 RepID=A0A098GG44_LEGMI|nr:hypothetical protein [Legionella micdadei]ARG97123.1 hypothetical protein B6N58_05295 [Legionella micdadei]KTD29282.1 hypothetical protein Lmic_1202 [Legionella micdadei]NSL17345.1 hypothetical protein [Legionella micdadei]CEG61438.1 conserved protein of unknown function [Legionella micdadei]SCY41031.1 hypothetical protein SAMN02982997_01646 [Legionella micdadei]